MKRTWNSLRFGLPEGDEDANRIALALASICNAETLRSLLDVVTFLDRYGGEATVAAYRFKFDPDGRRVPPEEDGSYETAGYLFHVDHVAKATRKATAAPTESDDGLGQELPLIAEVNEDTEGGSVDEPAPELVEAG